MNLFLWQGLCSPVSVDKTDLQFAAIPLFLLPRCWDCEYVPTPFYSFPRKPFHSFHEASPYSLYYCSLFVVTTEVPSSSQPCPLGCFDLQPPTFRTFWKSSDFQVVVAEICKNLFHPLSWKKYKSKFCVVFVMQRIFQLDLIG